MNDRWDYSLNLLGRLKDSDLETKFRQHYFSKIKHYLFYFFAVPGVLFFAFIIPDLLSYRSEKTLMISFAARFALLLGFLCLAVITRRETSYKWYINALTVLELILPFIYLLIIFSTGKLDYPLKCMDIILMVTVYFFFPNRWINSVMASSLLCLSFFIFYYFYGPSVRPLYFAAGVVYVTVMFLFAGFISLAANYLLRRHYANSLVRESLIYTDSLTGSYNRIKFSEVCASMMSLSAQTGCPLSLSVFDIDDFKRINDSYGHIMGDRVLSSLSNLAMDHTKMNEFFARWGGEEFVMLFYGQTAVEAAGRLNELKAGISQLTIQDSVSITCSFGVTGFRAEDNIDTFFDRADKLMYQAKHAGKNLVIYDGGVTR